MLFPDLVENRHYVPVCKSYVDVVSAVPPLKNPKEYYTIGAPETNEKPKPKLVMAEAGETWIDDANGTKVSVPYVVNQRHHNFIAEAITKKYRDGTLITIRFDPNSMSGEQMMEELSLGFRFKHPVYGTQVFKPAFYTQSAKQGVVYFNNGALNELMVNLHERVDFAEDMTRMGLLCCDAGRSIYYDSCNVFAIEHGYVLKGHVDGSEAELMRQIEAGTAYAMADGHGLARESHLDRIEECDFMRPNNKFIVYPPWDLNERGKTDISLTETLDSNGNTEWINMGKEYLDHALWRIRNMSEHELMNFMYRSSRNKMTGEFMSAEASGSADFIEMLEQIGVSEDKLNHAMSLLFVADGLTGSARNEIMKIITSMNFRNIQGVSYPVFNLPEYPPMSVLLPDGFYRTLYHLMLTMFWRYPFTDNKSTIKASIWRKGAQCRSLANRLVGQVREVIMADDLTDIHGAGKGSKCFVPDDVLDECTAVVTHPTGNRSYHLTDVDLIECIADMKLSVDRDVITVTGNDDIQRYVAHNMLFSITALLRKGCLIGIPESGILGR